MSSIFDEIYDFVLEQSTATRQQIIAELSNFDEVEVINELNRMLANGSLGRMTTENEVLYYVY